MDQLKEFNAGAEENTEDTVILDLTPFNPASPLILHWRCPDIARLYQVADDAEAIRRKRPLWSNGLLLDVAVMGQCHVGPVTGTPAGQFYITLASRTDGPGRRLWLYLAWELRRQFPDIIAFLTGAGDLKKIIESSLVSASSTTSDTPSNSPENGAITESSET